MHWPYQPATFDIFGIPCNKSTKLAISNKNSPSEAKIRQFKYQKLFPFDNKNKGITRNSPWTRDSLWISTNWYSINSTTSLTSETELPLKHNSGRLKLSSGNWHWTPPKTQLRYTQSQLSSYKLMLSSYKLNQTLSATNINHKHMSLKETHTTKNEWTPPQIHSLPLQPWYPCRWGFHPWSARWNDP